MRGYTTPPYMFFAPGKAPRSSRITEWPARASTVAAHAPAGPAPTTTTSTSTLMTAALLGLEQCQQRRRAWRWRR